MAHPKRPCQENNPFATRPQNKWGPFNAARDDERRQRAETFHLRSRAPQGFRSLTTHNKVRFGRLPARWRPTAEAELTRLVNKFIQTRGHAPSQQKLASLTANAAAIVRNHRMRQAGHGVSRWKVVQSQWFRTRYLLNRVDPPAASPPLTVRQRSSWRLTWI